MHFDIPPTETEDKEETKSVEAKETSLPIELVNTAKKISEMDGLDAMQEMGKITNEDPEKVVKIYALLDMMKKYIPQKMSLRELFNNPKELKKITEKMEKEE